MLYIGLQYFNFSLHPSTGGNHALSYYVSLDINEYLFYTLRSPNHHLVNRLASICFLLRRLFTRVDKSCD